MSTWKLQKLVYYCQAWHLVWDEEPLFPEKIEAWANGPVVRALYDNHRGKFKVNKWPHGKISRLKRSERETIDAVLELYGTKTGNWLRELTHQETPWREARKGLTPDERGSRKISHGALVDYYGSL
ncbi:MAG: hypothetical protein QOD83_4349 [Solirubrobacteraceae bacterium]|nr:hypothetical protein [Solirubrobacteraceae bacterium]